jgi:CRISPR-associated protein Cas6
MFWQEEKKAESFVVPENIVDVAFGIVCRALPVDHAWALSQAVRRALPWLEEEPAAGIHTLHVAESGNGWMRPDKPDDLLYPSRRTRLTLRLPRRRVTDAEGLAGRTLDIAGFEIGVGRPALRPLSGITTIFSRYVVIGEGDADEGAFLARLYRQLEGMGTRPGKILCGIERAIATPGGRLRARSLMLADLSASQSVRLQEEGLGPERLLGCGLFLPHKGIQEVGERQS